MRIVTLSFFLLINIVSCQQKSGFENEDLLYIYLNKSVLSNISEYYLLTIRTRNICLDCLQPTDLIIANAKKIHCDLDLYYLFDDPIYANEKKIQFNLNVKRIIIDSPDTLHKYGIHMVHPHLFHIKKGKILDWKIYYQ